MKKLLFISILLTAVLINLTYAQQIEPPVVQPPTRVGVLPEGITLRDFLFNVFTWVFTILMWVAVAFGVIYLILGGINVIITANVDKGKQQLIYGTVGLVIALLSYAIVRFIASILQTGQIIQ